MAAGDEDVPKPAEAAEPATGAEPIRRQLLVQTRVFLGIGGAIMGLAGIYIAAAEESAGSVMLVLAATLSFVCGGYLLFHLRSSPPPRGHLEAGNGTGALYLPHASIWPFWIGVAAFLLTNGVILGTWFLVPGGVIMIAAVIGFIAQSRRRS